MRKIILLFLLVFPITLFAQENAGIVFETGTWSEITAKAKAAGKPIFIDCYTSWCGPCKTLAKDIFTKKEVGDYFNTNFINCKFDMEKGEGIELRRKFSVSVYPTLIFVDANENIIFKAVGGSKDAVAFLAKMKKGVEDRALYKFKMRYDQGDRSDELIFGYLKTLEDMYMQKDAEVIVLDYFKDQNDYIKLNDKKYFTLFMAFITDIDSDIFKYVHKNREQLAALHGKRALDNKMYQMWLKPAVDFCKKGTDGQYVFDKKGYNKYIARLKKEKIDYLPLLIDNAEISNSGRLGDWEKYITLVEKRFNNPDGTAINATTMVEYGRNIVNKCNDPMLRKRVLPLFETTLAKLLKKPDNDSSSGSFFAKAFENRTNITTLKQIIEELKK